MDYCLAPKSPFELEALQLVLAVVLTMLVPQEVFDVCVVKMETVPVILCVNVMVGIDWLPVAQHALVSFMFDIGNTIEAFTRSNLWGMTITG